MNILAMLAWRERGERRESEREMRIWVYVCIKKGEGVRERVNVQ